MPKSDPGSSASPGRFVSGAPRRATGYGDDPVPILVIKTGMSVSIHASRDLPRPEATHEGSRRRLLPRPGLLVVLSALLAFGTVAAAPPARAEDARSFVILVDGLCTELAAGAPATAAFSGDGGLIARLAAAGWPEDSIAAYGYRGGVVDGDGRWQADAYACEDSRDQSLATDVSLLDVQLLAMAAAHPGATFHLVGFSLGGVVAFGHVGRLVAGEGGVLPGGARVASVTTLDSPLGGAPFVELLCGFAPEICGGTVVPASDSAMRDLSALWGSGDGEPAGARRSIVSRVGSDMSSNQAVATAAAAKGIAVLTVGNVRDWVYAPAGPGKGPVTFLDTQWLTNDLAGAGVSARAIDSGPQFCPDESGALSDAFGCNHALVLRDASAAAAILAVLRGSLPALASTCAGGRGGCLSLPPRPATVLRSTIAAGVVSGGGAFGTSMVTVKGGGRATLLVATSPALPGAVIQIWGRAANGTFRFLTSRVADRRGIVRYFTPPITGWAAIQARFAGDFVHGPGVSPARVVTVR